MDESFPYRRGGFVRQGNPVQWDAVSMNEKGSAGRKPLHKGVENIFSFVSKPQSKAGWGFFFPGRISGQVPICHASPVLPVVLFLGFLIE
jgi:hypothetical protein